MTSFTPSSELNSYIRIKIGEAKSKEEEDKYVVEDVESLREDISKASLPDKKQWEVILRIIYAEMLGHDTRFTHSFVVSCVQNPNYRVKRIAYVACMLLLDDDSPFRIMMVASLQKDLQNTCLYNKIIALNALPKMICPINAAAFIELIAKSAADPQQIVRKKALLALARLERVLPGSVEKFAEVMEKGLRDSDPGVMMATLPHYLEEAKQSPAKLRHLFDVFLRIITQIVDKKLPRDYEYENHGAPWAVISIFKILGLICRNDRQISEKLYQFLESYIKSFFVLLTDVDLVILYELLTLALTVYPSETLMALVMEKIELIERSLVMKKQDRRYLILKLIAQVVEIKPRLPAESHLLMLQSLESPDETIRQVSIEILFKTVNEQNVQLVCDRVESYLVVTTDSALKSKTIAKYYDMLQNKSPDGKSFLKRALTLLSLGSSNCSMDVVNKLVGSIQEIVTYSEGELPVDELLGVFEEHFAANPITDQLAQVFAWFIGAYVFQASNLPDSEAFVLSTFDYLLSQKFELEATYSFIYSALSKLKVKRASSDFSAKVNALLVRVRTDDCRESNLRIREYLKLENGDLWKVNSQIDTSLSFLESYVRKQVFKGAKVYNPQALSQLSKPQKPAETLVIKYTKEELEKNMRKIMQTNESEFRYSGKAKWKAGGYEKVEKGAQPEERKAEPVSAYVGMSSDEFSGAPRIAAPAKKSDELKQSLKTSESDAGYAQKTVSNLLGKKPKKGQTNKEKKQAQMAASLFAMSDDLFGAGGPPKTNFFQSSASENKSAQSAKRGFFGPKDAADQQQVQKTTAAKPANKDLLDFDLLGAVDSKKQQPLQSDSKTPTAAVKLCPNQMTLERYEEVWESLAAKEHSFEKRVNFNFSELEKRLKAMDFAIIDSGSDEIICATSALDSAEVGLLYASLKDNKSFEFTFRGDDSIKSAVLNKMREL